MNKFAYFLSWTAILSLSCNLVTGLLTEPALVEVTGPILGMTVAASLDDQGQPVAPSFTYPADQPEMVVVVWIGEVAAGALTFSWYGVTEAGDEALFEQTVAVEARDAAFSTGLNPGILAAGTYKVVATFAGGSETIAWDVADTPPGDLTAPLGTSASAAGAAPSPGPSGTTPAVLPSLGPGSVGSVSGPVASPRIWWLSGPPLSLHVRSYWILDAQTGVGVGAPVSFTVQVSPAITGSAPGVSRQYTHAAGLLTVGKEYEVNPCTLDGGSDLPDTSITVSAFPLGYEANKLTRTAVLGADTSGPKVQLVSAPSNGAKVKGGDKIVLTAIAEELKNGGSWQTGVSKIEIFVMEPSGEELLKKEYDEYEDKSCEAKSWKQTTDEITYEVPEDVRGDIRICAFGYDFARNPPAKKCYTYHTGDQLKGTLNWNTQSDDPVGRAKSVHQLDADLSLTLEPGGTLSGTAQIDLVMDVVHSRDCGSIREWVDPIRLTLPVTGTWTKAVIDFHFTTDAPIMVTKNFLGCGDTATDNQFDVAYVVGLRFHATWDGQAYTVDETIDCSSGPLTCVTTLTIHLEPPAPDVGFSPGAWAAASADQAWMDLTYP